MQDIQDNHCLDSVILAKVYHYTITSVGYLKYEFPLPLLNTEALFYMKVPTICIGINLLYHVNATNNAPKVNSLKPP